MKLANSEIVALYNTIDNMGTIAGTAKFAYTLSKNRATLKTIVDSLRDAEQSYMKDSVRAQSYQKAVEELVKTFSVDPDGKPMVRGDGRGSMQRVVPPARMQDFILSKECLDAEYNDVIVGMDAHVRGVQELLREETEVDLRCAPLKDFPAEIPQHVMNVLYVLVEEEQ
jgi:hypothetical protein